MRSIILGSALILAMASTAYGAPIIIDHNSIDRFSTLSSSRVAAVQNSIRWHYAHTSHGGQLTSGLAELESSNSLYNVSRGNRSLPSDNNSLNIYDGQPGDSYITPEEYWKTAAGLTATRSVLTANPSINVSMWSWCSQMNSYHEGEYSTAKVSDYLSAMAALEAEFPEVTFVYMTGNAQATGSSGLRRYNNNEMIRSWVRDSEKRVLFDFADLDAWYNDGDGWSQTTYDQDGQAIPSEHSAFLPDQGAGHTNGLSRDQKAKAVWLMMNAIEQHDSSPVPLPAAAWLLGSGLLGLVGLHRRRR